MVKDNRRVRYLPELAEVGSQTVEDLPALDELLLDEETRKKVSHGSRIVKRNSHTSTGFPGVETVWMYAGSTARKIKANSVAAAAKSGLTTNCQVCKGTHPESETNPNACPGLEPVLWTKCPAKECNTIIYGARKDGKPIKDKKVFKAKVSRHILAFHEATAAAMGLQYPEPVVDTAYTMALLGQLQKDLGIAHKNLLTAQTRMGQVRRCGLITRLARKIVYSKKAYVNDPNLGSYVSVAEAHVDVASRVVNAASKYIETLEIDQDEANLQLSD